MTTPENQPNDTHINSSEAVVALPPSYLLLVAGLGLLLAIGVLFTQPTFNVVGWGGLGIAGLATLAWVLMAPEQLVHIVRGRAFTFGGTAIAVTVVFIVALVLVYVVIRQQGWRSDFSQSDVFSLSEPTRALVNTLSADPTTPEIRILGFYNSAQAGQRDRAAVLLDDFVNASNGRITYEFINPDRNPQLADLYAVTPGQFVVAPLTADGEVDREAAEVVLGLEQRLIADALITVSASGDFRAYFLSTTGGISIDDPGPAGASIVAEQLRQRFNWTVQETSLFDLANREAGVRLGDTTADGEVLVVAGGQDPLPDDRVSVISDYLDSGGSLVAFAGLNLEGGDALITAPNISDYLFDNFGLRVNNDLLIDPFNSTQQSPLELIISDFGDHFVTALYNPQSDAFLMQASHSITVADQPPENVIISVIARTGPDAYSVSGLDYTQELTAADFEQGPDNPTGPFVVAAAAENLATGARVILFGSETLLYNQFQAFQSVGLRNLMAARDSLFWASGYDNFASSIPTLPTQDRPEQTPLFATDQQLRLITFVSVGVLPFSVLMLGVLVWWSRREREVMA